MVDDSRVGSAALVPDAAAALGVANASVAAATTAAVARSLWFLMTSPIY